MRVLVADSQSVFRAGLRKLLEPQRDVEVLDAATLGEAIATAGAAELDVVLIDLGLLPAGALQAVRMLRSAGTTKVIVWSLEPESESVFEAIRAGADGFLSKRISAGELAHWLRRAARGDCVLPRELTTLMIDALRTLDERERQSGGSRSDPLSARERQVLAEVAAGARNRQIANSLSISEFTVKRHIQNILHKLGVDSRREAAAFYRAVYASAHREEAADDMAGVVVSPSGTHDGAVPEFVGRRP